MWPCSGLGVEVCYRAIIGWYLVVVLFGVGGNLLSHNLPVAVPSARRRLSFRVRNGTGRFPAAINHRQIFGVLIHCVCLVDTSVLCQILHSGRVQQVNTFLFWCFCCIHTHVGCVVCLFWSISTSNLHILRCFQIWPINPIVFRGPQMKPHLKTGVPLRCFQRLSLPYVANQRCSWRNNWHTRGTSVPVLSY